MLNTARARIEPVERLPNLSKTVPDWRPEILAITARMTPTGETVEQVPSLHYSFDAAGQSASTQLMRVFNTKEEIRYGEVET